MFFGRKENWNARTARIRFYPIEISFRIPERVEHKLLIARFVGSVSEGIINLLFPNEIN